MGKKDNKNKHLKTVTSVCFFGLSGEKVSVCLLRLVQVGLDTTKKADQVTLDGLENFGEHGLMERKKLISPDDVIREYQQFSCLSTAVLRFSEGGYHVSAIAIRPPRLRLRNIG